MTLPTTLPNRSQSPDTFIAAADAFIAALPVFETSMNGIQVDVSAKQLLAATSATNAATSETNAGTSATNAATSATNALASATAASVASGGTTTSTTSIAGSVAFKSFTVASGKAFVAGMYVSISYQTDPTQYMYGYVTSYSGTTLNIQVTFANFTATYALWTINASVAVPNQSEVRSDRSTNTALASFDWGRFINVTSGTFTQTFSSAATLGNGWWCDYRNAGTGDITLSTSDSIDGLATFVMYSGETRRITCNGSTFTSMVLKPFYKVFTLSGTFVKPPGYTLFSGMLWSGGSGGYKSHTGAGAQGGGGGGSFPFLVQANNFGANENVTVGAGGLGTSTADTAGGVGGASSIGTSGAIIKMTVAAGYNVGSSILGITVSGNGVGFEASNGNFVTTYGGQGSSVASNMGANLYGGGAGGSIDSSGVVYTPGIPLIGGSGGAASVSGTAASGAIRGGGGGATQTGTSGAGGRGEVQIYGVV